MNTVNISNLAEAIILQSIEDLWDEYHKEDCIKFFVGEEFNMCAGMAGMNLSDQIKLLNMVSGLIKQVKRPVKNVHMENDIKYRYSPRRVIPQEETI